MVNKVRQEAQARIWMCIIYPQDIGEDWLERLESIGVPTFVSPLHDKDVTSEGELKKPHRHVLVQLDGKKSYSTVLSWFEPLGVKIVKRVNSLRREERYWCHLDSKDKVQYDVADCIALNGYEMKYLGERYNIDEIRQIHELIEDKGIVYYADLSRVVINDAPQLFGTLLKYVQHFNNVCYSRERLVRSYAASDNGSYVKYRYRRAKID